MIFTQKKRKWTTERLVSAIEEAYRVKGSKVYDKWLTQNGYSTPLSRIKKDGYSLKSFADIHGIGHLVEVRYRAKGYTRESIKKDILRIYAETNELISAQLLIDNGLEKQLSYVRSHYEGLENFLRGEGLSHIFKPRYKVLSLEEVVRRVREIAEANNGKVNMKAIQNMQNGTASFIYRNYGDLETFCKENSLSDIYDYKGGISWDAYLAEEVIREIFSEIEEKVTYSLLHSRGLHGLIHYIRNQYGSIQSFIEELHLQDVMDYSEPLEKCKVGVVFEKLVKESFDALNMDFIYHAKHFDGIIPDFYFEQTDKIVDAKLASYTALKSDNDFFDKYPKQCTELEIIYLNGEDIDVGIGNVKFTHISTLYKRLEDVGRSDLIEKFEEMAA